MEKFGIALLREGATRMTCVEANCQQYERGWITVVDERTGKGTAQAQYIRAESGRRFVEFPSEEAGEQLDGEMAIAYGLTVFKFYAGQKCFASHADREVVFVHGRRVHVNPRDFNEDFNETAQQAAEAAGRG